MALTMETLLRDNESFLRKCRKHSASNILIDQDYEAALKRRLAQCRKD